MLQLGGTEAVSACYFQNRNEARHTLMMGRYEQNEGDEGRI